MEANLQQLLDRFSEKTILVVGDAILDSYLEGSSTRLCREAAVPIVDVSEERLYPGGAANTAVNVAAMGANTLFISLMGKDPEGSRLLELLTEKQVKISHVLRSTGRRTLFKQRIVSGSQMVVRLDQGSTHPPRTEAEVGLLTHFLDHCYKRDLDAVILSDYGYGTISPPILAKLKELHDQLDYPLIVDAKNLIQYASLNTMAMTPNYAEAIATLKETILPVGDGRREQILDLGDRLLRCLNSKIVVVTMDEDGAIVLEQGKFPVCIPTVAKRGTVGGAGDTFISVFTLALCAGADAATATRMGVKAATIAVTLPGTATCTYDTLYRSFENNSKFLERCELNGVLSEEREKGARIIFTNGCFDLLHHGHIQHLREAAAQGDILVVGVNTDESVKRLKGDSRPINSFEDRVALLSALSFVDFVTPMPEENAVELVKEVKPDIFVKGGDYSRETLPEAAVVEELGGGVRLLPFHDGYSTTNLIEKIHVGNGR